MSVLIGAILVAAPFLALFGMHAYIAAVMLGLPAPKSVHAYLARWTRRRGTRLIAAVYCGLWMVGTQVVVALLLANSLGNPALGPPAVYVAEMAAAGTLVVFLWRSVVARNARGSGT